MKVVKDLDRHGLHPEDREGEQRPGRVGPVREPVEAVTSERIDEQVLVRSASRVPTRRSRSGTPFDGS